MTAEQYFFKYRSMVRNIFKPLDSVCIDAYYIHMNSKEVISKLKQDGWRNVGGKGDHEKFKHDTKPGHVVVPHPRKDIAIGTLKNIYRQAGWKWGQ